MALRILSIDGGGIRGIIAARWLVMLEQTLKQHCNKRLHDVFHVFSGTSTGALIAAALATGDFSPDSIYDMYRTNARAIFPKRRFLLFPRTYMFRPKYQATGLSAVLERELGNRRMSGIPKGKRLILVAFDAFSQRPVVFDSHDLSHKTLLLRDLCLASSSAPSFFPPKLLSLAGRDVPFIDGGLAANNPSAPALARVMLEQDAWPGALLASIGTGNVSEVVQPSRFTTQLSKRGWINSAKPVINYLFSGSSGINEEISRAILDDNFFRFQVDIQKPFGGLDDVSDKNLEVIEEIARTYWDASETVDKVNRLIAALDEGCPTSLSGRWRSTFTWGEEHTVSGLAKVSEVKFPHSSQEVIVIQQSGRMFCGETDLTKPHDFRCSFRGRLAGDHDLVGEWQSGKVKLTGMFQLRRDANSLRICRGFWTGTGATGLQVGQWTLEKEL